MPWVSRGILEVIVIVRTVTGALVVVEELAALEVMVEQ